jgi:bifunctional N-acetylglucosamine-1-phosphate-uridyltransferase/glucosamine-1-phosphate-acetyltransferase GlmU-like protein
MAPWSAVALALAEPGAGGLGSRLSKYLHPLAGRPLAWHTLCAACSARPAPALAVMVGAPELTADLFGDLDVAISAAEMPDGGGGDLCALVSPLLPEGGGHVLVVDAAAPLLESSVQRLLDSAPGTLLVDPKDRVPAAWLSRDDACRVLAGGGDLASLKDSLPQERRIYDSDAFVVESRAELARASARVRDRLVAALMEGGATFLLPETVLVDVDVRIGRDAVVYPNVVLEGQTTVGEETVIGPGCRIVDSWIGSGVELKGFNYLSHTSVRNRAILEPHVRRGFD